MVFYVVIDDGNEEDHGGKTVLVSQNAHSMGLQLIVPFDSRHTHYVSRKCPSDRRFRFSFF